MSQQNLFEQLGEIQERVTTSHQDNGEDSLLVPESETCLKKPRKEPTETMVMIGQRFKYARHLTGMSEQEAIVKMGFHNKKVISQIENAHRLPTVHFIIRAANAYGVPADFLLCMSDDEDPSSTIAHEAAIYRHNEQMVQVFAKLLSKTTFSYAKSIGDATTQEITQVAEELHKKFNRFVELNPEFLDMRGGAPVQNLILSLMPLVRDAKKQILQREGILEKHRNQLACIAQRQLLGV